VASQEKRSARRSAIPPAWQPGPNCQDFAESLGVAPNEIEAFRDYHLSRGSLMADWNAAWRTWCRNQVTYGRASGQRSLPLFSVVATAPVDDPYGASTWAATVPGAKLEQMEAGRFVPCLNGFDLAGVAVDLCSAVGLAPSWRGDLSPIAGWLLAGIDPEAMVSAVRSCNPPRVPGQWRYYDSRVRERAASPGRAYG